MCEHVMLIAFWVWETLFSGRLSLRVQSFKTCFQLYTGQQVGKSQYTLAIPSSAFAQPVDSNNLYHKNVHMIDLLPLFSKQGTLTLRNYKNICTLH